MEGNPPMFSISVSNIRKTPCDLMVPSPSITGKKDASEFNLFLRGIIRSVWHDVSKEITVTADDDLIRGIIADVAAVMGKDEGISFREV